MPYDKAVGHATLDCEKLKCIILSRETPKGLNFELTNHDCANDCIIVSSRSCSRTTKPTDRRASSLSLAPLNQVGALMKSS
jgi:hypothetical protein